MSAPLVTKKNGLMYLSMGVLSLFLMTFFYLNSNLNQNTKASGTDQLTGILISDPRHMFPCNTSARAQYVLRDLQVTDACTPVVANKSLVNPFLGQSVILGGVMVKGVFYATSIRSLSTTILPTPYVIHTGPDYSPLPVGESTDLTPGYGPAAINPY